MTVGSDSFHVELIDHITLFVPDRYEAARWYSEVLGLEIRQGYEQWAEEGGPLMIGSIGGRTMIAVFEGKPHGSRRNNVEQHIAFRIDGPGFIEFVERATEIPLTDGDHEVTRVDIVDHELAFSIYFDDPYGDRFEVTTYAYRTVSQALDEMNRH